MLETLALLLTREFSPTVFAACVLALTFYLRGVGRLNRAGTRVGRGGCSPFSSACC